MTTAPTSLFAVDDANSRLLVGVYSDLNLLTTTSSYSIPVTATVNDPRNTGLQFTTSNFDLLLEDPCLTTSISANPISIVMMSLDPTSTQSFAEYTDTVSVIIGGTSHFCGNRLYEIVPSSDLYTLSLSVSQSRTF